MTLAFGLLSAVVLPQCLLLISYRVKNSYRVNKRRTLIVIAD